MASGLRFQIIWSDADCFEVRVRGSNGRFTGEIDAYASLGRISMLAQELEGFPRSSSDTRDVVVGNLSPEFAGGAVRLRFSCSDLAGHCVVDAEFKGDAQLAPKPIWLETAQFRIRFEAAALDAFLVQLRRLESAGTGSVSELEGSDD